MMPLVNAGEVVVLDALLTGRYLALHTGDPTGGNEVTGTNYVRQSADFSSLSGPDPTIYDNDAEIEFPAAGDDWGTVTHFSLWTAESSGSMLAYAALSASKAINTNDIARWAAGALTVEAD